MYSENNLDKSISPAYLVLESDNPLDPLRKNEKAAN